MTLEENIVTLRLLKEWKADLYVVIRDAYTASTNLHIIDVEKKRNNPFVNHKFFSFYSYQQKFIIIIQLAKLFDDNDNQKRNFNKLLNRLEHQKLDDEIKALLDKNSPELRDVFRNKIEILIAVKEFRKKLTEHSDLVKRIVTLRDKVYAHTDPEKEFINISFEEIKIIIDLATEVYNTFFGKIVDLETLFYEDAKEWDLRYIVESLSFEEE